MAKNPPKKPEAEAQEEEAPAPKKKGKKLLLIGAAVLIVGVGAGTWFFAFKDKGTAGAAEAKASHPAKPPVFVNLEPFTVNLQPETGEQYLQVVATLKVLDAGTGETVKTYMPEIRHRILMLLSAKRASEISSVEGRERLADELRRETDLVIWTAKGVKPPVPEPAKPIGEAPAADQAEGEQSADAPAAAPPAEPAAKPVPPKAASEDPVQSVLFTSFIIQ